MKLLVEGVDVDAEYVPFDQGGFFLQLLISASDERRTEEMHSRLDTTFRAYFPHGAVMDEAEISKGASEIRLLARTKLEAIDVMRTEGFGVRETVEL